MIPCKRFQSFGSWKRFHFRNHARKGRFCWFKGDFLSTVQYNATVKPQPLDRVLQGLLDEAPRRSWRDVSSNGWVRSSA